MKNIAVITGASSGMGKEFALTLKDNINVDELWLIARNKTELENVSKETHISCKILNLDLSNEKDIDKYILELEKEKANIKLLINAAGYGKFEKTTKLDIEDNLGMINLNIKALTKMCIESVKYMDKGSRIINISSLAAFQPVPYMNVYAASKAYVLSFSRALNVELKNDGVHVMAMCPYWTKTKFFDRAETKNKVVKKYVVMYTSKENVQKAWKDLKKNKEISKCGFISKKQVLLCKLMPHKLIMKIWIKQQGLNSYK